MSDARREQYAVTVHALNQAYPDGWRCCHDFTDGLTVILAAGLRQMTEALLQQRRSHRG